ncbi:MAG: hypothetical protein ACI8VW_000552 [bacterium]|jgi:hypothetical protein
MHSLRHPNFYASSTNNWLRSMSVLAIAGCLLLTGVSTRTTAAETSYRSNEGHTYNAEQLGADLTPPLGINSVEGAMKNAPGNDNHLTLNAGHVLWFGGGIWVTNVGTLLYTDKDQDGYFSGFSLTIDADTDYSQADVYATIDVQRIEGERERLHTTGTFSLYGNSLTDEYRVDIELVRNYLIGDYDLFINLVDANDHTLVDRVGPNDISNLSYLPLESEEFDYEPAPFEPATPMHTPNINKDIRVVEHAGASSTWLLLAMGIPFITRRFKNARLNKIEIQIIT